MRKPFDIVHVTQSAFPDDPRPRREAVVAAQIGARVAVVALREGRDDRPVSRYGQILVVRLPGSKRRGSLIRYVSEYSSFLLRARALFRRDPRFRGARVVHVHSLPDFLIAAATPARRRGARLILDLHEIFPEFARAKFAGLAGRIIAQAALWAESWSRRQATVVLTVNRAVEKLLRSRPSRDEERLVVIHNLPDFGELGPPAAPREARNTTVRLVYHGTLTNLYGLDLALTAVHQARSAGVDARFDIYGSGPDQAMLAREIDRLQLGDAARLCGVIPHEELRARLTEYDAGLLATRLNTMTQYSLSTKLLEYVHLAIPVIAPRIPTYCDYFPENLFWYYAPNDPSDAARAIKDFDASSADDRSTRARGAQAAIAHLTWAAEAARLASIYRQLLENGTPSHPHGI